MGTARRLGNRRTGQPVVWGHRAQHSAVAESGNWTKGQCGNADASVSSRPGRASLVEEGIGGIEGKARRMVLAAGATCHEQQEQQKDCAHSLLARLPFPCRKPGRQGRCADCRTCVLSHRRRHRDARSSTRRRFRAVAAAGAAGNRKREDERDQPRGGRHKAMQAKVARPTVRSSATSRAALFP